MTAITRTNIAAGPNSGIFAFVELDCFEEPTDGDSEEPVDGDSEEPTDGDSEEPVDGDSEEPTDGDSEEPVDGGVLDAVAAKVDGTIVRIITRINTLNSTFIDFDFIVISANLYFIKTLQFLFYH